VTENDLLARAAAVEANSEHPLAKAIVAGAQRRNLSNSNAADFEALPVKLAGLLSTKHVT
jgi:cation transport ATPase